MSRDEKRPTGGGNLQQANDESAPSDSITESVPLDHELHQDAPGPSTPQEREARARRARSRLREADERRRASRALSSFAAEISERESMGWFAASDRWTRDLGNDFVAQGFAVDYVARRLGLPLKMGAST